MIPDDFFADIRQAGMRPASHFFSSIRMAKAARFRTKNSTFHSHLRPTTRASQRHPLAANAGLAMPELAKMLPEAIEAVQGGVCAVLDAHLDGPQGKYGGGKAALIG
jgi:hypothetical protein